MTEKLRDLVRGAVTACGSRPDVAAGVAAGVLYLLLPGMLGLDYRLVAQRGPYQLLWLNLLGAHYRLHIETPKPLSVLLAGLLGSGPAFYILTCAVVGLCVALVVRLGKAISGSYWPGAVAAVTVLALRGDIVYYILIGGTEAFHIALVLLAVVALASGRFRAAALAVFGACLQRPEAWSLAPIPLLLALATRRRFNLLLLLPFIAPIVWVVFDRAMTGDWFYSLHETAYYFVAAGLSTSSPGSFWGEMTVELAKLAGDVPFVVGMAGLGIWLWKYTRGHAGVVAGDRGPSLRPAGQLTAAVGLALSLPLLASWMASFSGHVLQMGRFHYPSVMLLTLLATSVPFFLFSNRVPRWFVLVMSVLVGLSALAPREVARSIRMARVDEIRATAYDPVADTVKQLIENGSAEVAIVSQRRLHYFCMLLGQVNSWKLLTVREVKNVAGTIPAATKSAVLAYYNQDEISIPPTDSVIRWMVQAWQAPAVLETIALTPDSLGGVWFIKSACTSSMPAP